MIISSTPATAVYKALMCGMAIVQSLGSPTTEEIEKKEKIIEVIASHGSADLVVLAAIESDFNPRAKSPRGAVGLLQIMPDTARELLQSECVRAELDVKVIEHWNDKYLYDPYTNSVLGYCYLRHLTRLSPKSMIRVLVGYNSGPATMTLPESKWPRETVNYVIRFQLLREEIEECSP